jgi:ubiquinone/menaquinone biosynthesis C-methylase UbiE
MKDNFSPHAHQYGLYRPSYPNELFTFLNTLVTQKINAWDCGTGNGQVALKLSSIYQSVFATDISLQQLNHATAAYNIQYSVQAAEQTQFSDQMFDLIIAAQAAHWFDFDQFYNEVRRTAKPNAIICLLGYGNIKITPEIDVLVSHFYEHIIGPYWDAERRYIDEAYQTIPFPFTDIQTPTFQQQLYWSFEQLIGYLNTWSGVKHFITQNKENPVATLAASIQTLWPTEEQLKITFPIFMRVARVFDYPQSQPNL